MRGILFRGKDENDGTWYEGFFVKQGDDSYIFTKAQVNRGIGINGWLNCCQMYSVIPKTIGQYTGLKDKNGKRIFEGDIVRYIYEPGKGFWNAHQLSVIEYDGTGYHMKGIFGTNKYACMSGWLVSIPYDQEVENIPEFEVIGNIHDNQELLKEETK